MQLGIRNSLIKDCRIFIEGKVSRIVTFQHTGTEKALHIKGQVFVNNLLKDPLNLIIITTIIINLGRKKF